MRPAADCVCFHTNFAPVFTIPVMTLTFNDKICVNEFLFNAHETPIDVF